MIPRIHTRTTLNPGEEASLPEDQSHYLVNVLRRKPGDEIRLFNAAAGEYRATISQGAKKKSIAVVIHEQLRAPQAETELALLFAPVKRGPTEFIIQKGVELGVTRFLPTRTVRTNNDRLNISRLQAIACEAAEQCGRLGVPSIDDMKPLEERLASWPDDEGLIFCDEAGDDPDAPWGGETGRAVPFATVDFTIPVSAILIGPEGGFAPDERRALRARAGVSPVTLGPRILRADTAAIVALTLWQAKIGDLRSV